MLRNSRVFGRFIFVALADMFAREPHVAPEMLTFLELEHMFDATELYGARKMLYNVSSTCTHVGCYGFLWFSGDLHNICFTSAHVCCGTNCCSGDVNIPWTCREYARGHFLEAFRRHFLQPFAELECFLFNLCKAFWTWNLCSLYTYRRRLTFQVLSRFLVTWCCLYVLMEESYHRDIRLMSHKTWWDAF